MSNYQTKPKYKTGIFLFTNDLRLHDQPALMNAAENVSNLICLHIYDEDWKKKTPIISPNAGIQRRLFLSESLQNLDAQLGELGQKLISLEGNILEVLPRYIQRYSVEAVYSSVQSGWYERATWQKLKQTIAQVSFQQIHTRTLFDEPELPFHIDDLPASFSKFRKLIETQTITREIKQPLSKIEKLPSPPSNLDTIDIAQDYQTKKSNSLFKGGELAALKHLEDYFLQGFAQTYKETRNELSDWTSSTKFSPWLANGNLSPRLIYQKLKEFEKRVISNDSTYWIYFELLWREYFQWYDVRYDKQLFRFSGIGNKKPLTAFYPERYQKWVSGNTPYPLVNACMKELQATGFISNRARQIVASCLVHELAIDWRYGAAYFQEVLIDHDVGSNWGNWQYIAGVGADPRGGRHFNLQKQQEIFDPDLTYINQWANEISNESKQLDSLDAADWPITTHA